MDRDDPTDLDRFHRGDRAKGLTPYCVRVTVTNGTGADFAFSSLGLTTPVLGDGSPAQGLSIISRFDRCPNEDAGPASTTKGARYQTCVVGLATSSTQVAGPAYRGSAFGNVQDEPDHALHPVIWTGRPTAPTTAGASA